MLDIDIIKELYLSGYRFYVKNNILYLDEKNIVEKKENLLNLVKNNSEMKDKIKKLIMTFKKITLVLNNTTIRDISKIITNDSLLIINCDYELKSNKIIIIFKILDKINKNDKDYLQLLSKLGVMENA